LVTGGGHNFFGGSVIEKTAEIYGSATESWQFTDDMSRARFGHRATVLSDGRVLLTGGAGRGGDCVSNLTAEIYDASSARFNPTRPMSTARGFHAATPLSDGKILVTGGNTIARQVLIPGVPPICTATTETAELFDPDSETWTSTVSMSISRSGQTLTLLS